MERKYCQLYTLCNAITDCFETFCDAKKKVSALDGVVTVVENNGQFQVVIGNAVASVYKEFEGLVGEEINNQLRMKVKKEQL